MKPPSSFPRLERMSLDEAEKLEAAGELTEPEWTEWTKTFFSPWRATARRNLERSGYRVELEPGLATVQGQDDPFTVELEYILKAPKGTIIRDVVSAVRIEGDIPDQVDLGPYFDAFTWALFSEPRPKDRRAPRRRPQPGKPFDPVFYRQVVGLHNSFRDEGRKDPSAAVAAVMGESPALVRLWVHRGRSWIKKHDGKEGE